jgi:DNA-binding protein H-NS
MSQDLSHLSLEELHALATRAQKALEEKRKESRKAVIAQIKELADSIGVSVSVTITDGDKPVSARKGSKVASKYRNPHNHDQTWTGRGVKPRWLAALVEQGRRMEEFLI